MRTRLRTLAAAGLVGLVVGGGIGMAVAQPRDGGAARPVAVYESMDQMHTAMRDALPPELAAQCDEMHASMPAGMGSMAPGSMMGGAPGSMAPGSMGTLHGQHHR